MSQRVKRPNRSEDGSVPVKRRKRTAVEEEEAASLAASWQSRTGNDNNRIYNRTTTEAPAELFRKDLISAMKLPDSEPLSADEYWIITDQWKQEWERGVQVPVNPDFLPEPSVAIHQNHRKPLHEFKLPKNKYIRITKDDNFKLEEHMLSNAPTQAEDACSYDLDECDVAWLRILNSERASCGLGSVHEDQLERVMEQFELCCWDKIQTILRNEEGLGIEFDENVICDVCRSPDSEEGNEMVFCDSCNICVHQACYGITRIPDGQWLCCTCHLGKRPKCVLCPNKGGAMKSTRSGQKWAHVSCALWIPEVSIGCVEKMEPITKISSIPQSRWALICVLCRERVGACIQCSVKTCKTAYHVTCAFKHGLEMRAIIEDENADDGVKLRSYCEKHSKSSKKDKSICSGSEEDDNKRRKRKDMTSEEKNQARAARLQEIETEFYKHVSVKDVSLHLNVDQEALLHIYNYWKLKRRAAHNKPLLPPKTEDIDMLSHKREQADKEKLKMFVQLRQDLERVRNLCYMVSRREKLSRTFFKLREQTFFKQTAVLEAGINLPTAVINAVIEANHGPSMYDKLYSHDKSEDHTSDFELIMARIAGIKSPTLSGDEKKPEINGLFKDVKNNPYQKVYMNGSKSRRSRSLYSSMSSSASSSDEKPKENKENRLHNLTTTTDEDKPTPPSLANKKNKPKKQINKKITERRKRMADRVKLESSSEEDEKPPIKKEWTTSFTRSKLSQVEHELGLSGTDSDDLMDIRNNSRNNKSDNHGKMFSIYSDTDSSDSTKNSNANNSDSQQRLRTKASVKEFIQRPSTSKTTKNSTSTSTPNESKKKTKPEDRKENSKKKDYVPSDLIVPQRQAAKKATENLKSTTTARTKDAPQSEESPSKNEEKPKVAKQKSKSSKETSNTTPREIPKEKIEKMEVSESDKDDKIENPELLAYVPQRQAAKKAAEHIKSGLGKSILATADATINNEIDNNKSKKDESVKTKKDSNTDSKIKKDNVEQHTAAKIPESKRKSSSNSSSSSSTSSSSGSSSSSSSSSSDDEPEAQQKPSRSESSFSAREQTKRANAKDRPFLDKGTKSATSSSNFDSQKPHSQPETNASTPLFAKSPRKGGNNDKRTKSPTPEREELKLKGRSPRGGRACLSNLSEVGNSGLRRGDLSDSKRVLVERDGSAKTRKRKQSTSDKLESSTTEQQATSTTTTTTTTSAAATEKTNRSSDILSPIRQKDKKLNQNIPDDKLASTLEKEILERKASKENKTKSTLDRLFGPIGNLDKLSEKHDRNSKRSPRKETSIKKSPNKSHKIANLLTSPKRTVNDDLKESNDNNHHWIKPQNSDSDLKQTNKFISDISKSDKENSKNLSPKNMNRSIFSPQPNKDSEFDFDNFEDNFGISKEDEVLKPFTFNNAAIVNKEDTKEDNVRETLNLVEKLRMGLSKKPATGGGGSSCEAEETLSTGSNSKNDDRSEFLEQVVPNNPPAPAEEYNVQHPVDRIENSDPMVNFQMRIEIDKKNFEQHTESHQNYPFLNCQADVPIECNKNVPIEQHQGLSGDLPAQGDERWVPPSEPTPTFANFSNNHHFNEQFSDNHHKKYPEINNMFAEVGARLQEEVLKNQSSIVQGRRLIDSIPEIIPDLHMQPPKWAENVLLPNRRSSTSSAASTLSSTSRRNDQDVVEEPNKLRSDMMLVNPPNIDISLFPPQNIPSFQPNALEPFGTVGFPDASPFVNPVSLFAGPNLNTQLAFPSAGPAGFPPAFGSQFPTPHSIVAPLPKPEDTSLQFPSTCTAAFTSSQHNMALTAAMVNLPTSKDIEPCLQENPIVCPNSVPIDSGLELNQKETVPPPQESPIVSSAATSVASSPSQKSTPGKKSPSKPTRCSARVSSQKSPGKSPGKSPRQEVAKSEKVTKKEGKKSGKNSSGKGGVHNKNRGRGRGKGRPPTTPHHMDFDIMGNTNTIQKLVGTVYDLDFDDEWNDNTTDLKAMRERRKSTDVHDKKENAINSSASDSPRFSSPSQNSYKNRSYNVDLSNLRPPTPIEDSKDNETNSSSKIDNGDTSKSVFPDIVPPLLPGPVDMRTYNTYEEQKYESTNLLQAFAAGTTENQAHEEIDEEYEKELHAALMGKQKSEQNPTPEVSNIKVSLSDSRNQLKVKIKGPIANYTSSVTPTTTPTVDPIVVSNISSNSASINVSNNANASGTSNLRRMRKKELLRQYWSQDMSMDDPSRGPASSTPIAPPMNRTTITIPKAVTSVTSIPTKDDYRDYRTFADDFLDSKHHRKDTKSRSALSRELRHLDLTLDETGDKRGNNSSLNESNKRRGRPPRNSSSNDQVLTTPKLKIKIGNNSIISSSRVDDKRDKVRPPKKRLANIPMPSVEDLKRESMKYRKMVMAGFDEKRRKKDKSEKRKKKKKQQVEIVANESVNPTKLIIRFGKKPETGEEAVNKRTSNSGAGSDETNTNTPNSNSTSSETLPNIPIGGAGGGGENASSAGNNCGDSLPKLTPIKLKLSRCQEGSVYVMKPVATEQKSTTNDDKVAQPGQPPPRIPTPPSTQSSTEQESQKSTSAEFADSMQHQHPPPAPLPLNKDCEVR